VAASFNAPLLFQIANDLTQMQIRASVDEADIGRIQRARSASFTVDALPGRTFPARLDQVRLNPTVTNNVVIYTCIFRVENRDPDGGPGPLLPGLTANLTAIIDQREEALLVPAAALRFQPKGIPAASRPAGAKASSRPAHEPRDRREPRDTAYLAEPPEDGDGMTAGPGTPGLLWVREGETALRAVPVRTGLTDGLSVEVLSGALRAGDLVAIAQTQQADAAPQGSFSPFGGARPNMGGKGMGRGGR
jgi:HlyD family secretion protein